MPPERGLHLLAAALDGGEIRDVVRLGGGLDCATHAFEVRGERFVLKRSRPGSTSAAAVEFANLGHAWRSEVTTPEPVALDIAGDWFGSPALVMTALPGAHNLFPDDEETWLRDLAHALARLHDTPTAGFPRRRPPYWDRWQIWTDELDDRLRAVVAAIDELRSVAPSEPEVFTHDDYHPGNTIFVGDRLTGVVDWSHAALEPRQAAVAYCRKDLAIHPGRDTADRFLSAYEAEVGFRLDDMDLWDILYGARALQWGRRWVPAFAEVGVQCTAAHIRDASAAFIDAALALRARR